MIRTLASFSALVLVAGLSHATQDHPAPKKADVVKELNRDFDEARAGLQKDDPGAKTRAAHRRIIDGLEELLKQEEDKSNASPPANPPAAPPAQPAPKESQPSKNQQPMPEASAVPKANPMAGPKSIPQLTPTPEGKVPDRPDGPWDTSRSRRQEAVDAVGRERFPPRYEELLRAYYRSLAGRGEEQ